MIIIGRVSNPRQTNYSGLNLTTEYKYLGIIEDSSISK